LDRSEIILAYLKFDKKEELKDLQTKVSFVELVEHGFNDINGTQEFKEKSERVKKEYQRIKSEKDDDERKQSLIYQNTISFLEEEQLIKSCREGGYRLTSKSFAHLNKTFRDGKLENEESSYIKAIKALFSNTSKTSKEVAVGLAVNIIPKLLGIS